MKLSVLIPARVTVVAVFSSTETFNADSYGGENEALK